MFNTQGILIIIAAFFKLSFKNLLFIQYIKLIKVRIFSCSCTLFKTVVTYYYNFHEKLSF